MVPIAQLTSEVARSLDGVCFDIDDTVTSHGVLDAPAYTAIVALKAAGLKLLAVTGRPLGWAELVARMWPVDGAIGENGAGYVARLGNKLSFGFWDDEATRNTQAAHLLKIRARVAREMPHVCVSSDSWARRCDIAFDVGEYASLPAGDVDRLICLLQDEGARVTVSSIHAHAQMGSHDKASGVALAARALFELESSVVASRFMFVGDSSNDAPAFGWFQTTVGVANVSLFLDRLPVAPRFISSASRGEGFAEIADRVLTLRRS